MNYDNYKFSKYEDQHNETRWAKVNEIKSTNTKLTLSEFEYEVAGLPILNDGETAYVDGLDNHSLIFGATGSKKTRLFCMPTLQIMIGAGESFIVTDPKGELYERSSGAAKEKGYNIIVLNYRDLEKGDNWNPLSLPFHLYKKGDKEAAISRLSDFVNAISEKQSQTTNDIFWVNAAKTVSMAVLITMLDCCTEEECNLKTFTRMCTDFSKCACDPVFAKACGLNEDEIQKNYLQELMSLAAQDSIARLNFEGINSSSDKARGDIQSTLFTLISIFLTQESLIRNMGKNSFDINMIGRQKTALYLIVPDERTNYHFIATTFIKQCYESLIVNAQLEKNKQLPIRVNFLLDEFANIPRIPDMPSMISAGRSRNIRFFLILQSMHQLKEKYKNEAETIKGNCENWVFLSSKEIELLKEISDLAGKVDKCVNNQITSVSLISISQLQRLDKQSGEALIFCGRHYPFITKMADIDSCNFKKYEPIKLKEIEKYDVISVNSEILFNDMLFNKRNLPFKDITMNKSDANANKN